MGFEPLQEEVIVEHYFKPIVKQSQVQQFQRAKSKTITSLHTPLDDAKEILVEKPEWQEVSHTIR